MLRARRCEATCDEEAERSEAARDQIRRIAFDRRVDSASSP